MEVDQKSPLLRLPNELLSQIFSYVGGAHWRNVRRVCRRIRAVALPIMHRDKVAATLIDQLNRPSVIDRFERNPEFVRYVKSLTVHYHMGLTDCLPKCYDIIRDPPYVEDLSPLIAQMEQLQSLAIKGNSHEVCYGAELAKLDQEHRAHCTKSKWMGACTKFQDLFIKSASSPILTNLQTCVLNFFDVDEFWDLSLRDVIFLHPHLKRLSISGAKSGTFRYLDECYRHSTVLEELTLRGCDISPDSLRGILTIPKALKRLTFNGRIPGRRAYSDAPRQSYIDSIQEQAHSLVALDLCLPLDVLYPFLREHAPNTPVDFHAFRSLQELTTVTQVIEGNPVLRPHPPATNPFPASLKTLRLRYLSRHRDSEWESPYRSAIRGWAATGALPSLTSVVFISHPTDNDCGVPEAWQMDSPSRIITFERDPYKCPAPLPQLPAGEKCSCCDSNREIALLPPLHYL